MSNSTLISQQPLACFTLPKHSREYGILSKERQPSSFPELYSLHSLILKPSSDDIKLSMSLAVPILCGEPQKTTLYSTKSGCKRIFQQADVPIPISAYDLYDEQEFIGSLAKLIATNLFVDTWVFKIDDEFNG